MCRYKVISTSAEVWSAIKARHHSELVVFGSYSAPDGDPYGRDDQGRMMTEYGFKDADYPLMRAETTWNINREDPAKRENEKHQYWLFMLLNDD